MPISFNSSYCKLAYILFFIFICNSVFSQVSKNNSSSFTLSKNKRYSFNQVRGQNISALDCNSWLKTTNPGDCVKIGDVDISGDQLTVEATINRIAPYAGNYLYAGDIVSKHADPANVNYLLRPNDAEITTYNGYYATPEVCDIELNKTYHIAMVYDGTLLKFYRNGYLMSQTYASGNLYQNDFLTTIGDWSVYINSVGTNFKGFINEVRIWNVARTQSQLRSFMNSSLPNPTTQLGLVAYYQFNSPANLQGNSNWNGNILNNATINNTNPVCSVSTDSCLVNPTSIIGGIINQYASVNNINTCNNELTLDDASGFHVGDTVLMIQMNGAEIDSNNISTFGDVTNYHNAGNYEFNYISNINGNTVTLLNQQTHQYNIGLADVQLVRVPYFINASVSNTLTCMPWNGHKGGVLAFNVQDTLKLNANIDVSGNGFRGAAGINTIPGNYNCSEANYFYDASTGELANRKGEGISHLLISKSSGRGKMANGGGGGNSHNAGGGGGANGGNGGKGGYQLQACTGSSFDNGGIGGLFYNYNTPSPKVFMGGGGGAGHTNNPDGFTGDGGNGGGLIFLHSNVLISNGNEILNNGAEGLSCNLSGSGCHEGMGGGGAGGTTLLDVQHFSTATTINNWGGKGASMIDGINGLLGPGGGGGGGAILFSTPIPPINTITNIEGGLSGTCVNYANDNWGATPGNPGIIVPNISFNIDQSQFAAELDSVSASYTHQSCQAFQFNGLVYPANTNIVQWSWDFGDGNMASSQNANHQYASSGNYQVVFYATTINGCIDSVVTEVVNDNPSFLVNSIDTICAGSSFSLPWGINVNTPGLFSHTYSTVGGCDSIVNVRLTVLPTFNDTINAIICQNDIFSFPWGGSTSIPGFYSHQYYSIYGCDSMVTINLVVNPSYNLMQTANLCEGNNFTLPWGDVVNTTGTYAHNYYTASGCDSILSISLIANPNYNIDVFDTTCAGAVYHFPWGGSTQTDVTVSHTYYTVNGCDSTINLHVYFISPTPSSENITACDSIQWHGLHYLNSGTFLYTHNFTQGCAVTDTLHLTINSSSHHQFSEQVCDSLMWNNSHYYTSGIYLYEYTNNVGCISVDTLHLTVHHSVIQSDTVKKCLIDLPYLWHGLSLLSSGNYNDTLSNINGCDSIIKLAFSVLPNPIADAGADQTIFYYETTTLQGTGGNQYLWSPASLTDNPISQTPTVHPQRDTWFILTVTDANGCKDEDSVFIKVNLINTIQIPNAFSPNGDGLNDEFRPIIPANITSFILTIYNRWGEKIFESTNSNKGWDGKFKNENQPIGTYIYTCSYLENGILKTQKGAVLLIR